MAVAVRLTRLHARSGGPKVRLTRLRALAAPDNTVPPETSPPQVRLTRLRAFAAPAGTTLQARAGADATVQALQPFTLDGSTSVLATGLAWTQDSGPAVTLGGTGGVRTGTAPAVATGAVLVFRLTATGPGGTSTDIKTITVPPWLHWRWNGTAWVPERMFFIG